jgi:hypothetical protein
MIPAKVFNGMSETEESSEKFFLNRITLEKFERSKILETYFSRLDGHTSDDAPAEYHELFEIELEYIKTFLLGQYPQDPILQRIFKIMN